MNIFLEYAEKRIRTLRAPDSTESWQDWYNHGDDVVDDAWEILKALDVAREVATRAIDLYEGAVQGFITLIPSNEKALFQQGRLEAECDAMRSKLGLVVDKGDT